MQIDVAQIKKTFRITLFVIQRGNQRNVHQAKCINHSSDLVLIRLTLGSDRYLQQAGGMGLQGGKLTFSPQLKGESELHFQLSEEFDFFFLPNTDDQPIFVCALRAITSINHVLFNAIYWSI